MPGWHIIRIAYNSYGLIMDYADLILSGKFIQKQLAGKIKRVRIFSLEGLTYRGMQTLIKQISPQNFRDEVLSVHEPVLLLCMPSDDDFPDQIKILEHVARSCGTGVRVGFLNESCLESIKEVLQITGTPTFLIFYKAKEINRMLGLADRSTLGNFMKESMQQIKIEH